METGILFTELQQSDYSQFLVILFALLPANAFLIFQVIRHFNLKNTIILGIMIFATILCVIFSFTRLEIEVSEKEIKCRLYPFYFSNQIISKEEIVGIEKVIYESKNWGGWGVRTNSRGDKAYTMYGNKGVQVTLKNGKIILLGTQKPNQLYKAISIGTD